MLQKIKHLQEQHGRELRELKMLHAHQIAAIRELVRDFPDLLNSPALEIALHDDTRTTPSCVTVGTCTEHSCGTLGTNAVPDQLEVPGRPASAEEVQSVAGPSTEPLYPSGDAQSTDASERACPTSLSSSSTAAVPRPRSVSC